MASKTQGYPVQWDGEKTQYVHITIAEQALGKRLPRKAQVHHVNGNREDNRKSNLVVCQSKAYHALLHIRAAALRETGNANSRYCRLCKKWGIPGEGGMTVAARNDRRDSAGVSYHRECRRVYEAKRTGRFFKRRTPMVEIKVGQVWRPRDTRRPSRSFTIMDVAETFVETDRRNGRVIGADRLRSRKYELVQDVEEKNNASA